MGIDVYLEHSKCPTCNHEPEKAYEGSYTYNVSKMWTFVYPEAPGMLHIDDLKGYEAIPILEYAIRVMCEHKKELLEFQHGNDWGSYEGFLQFIREVLAASQDNPDLIWRVWR